jgi:predicted ATPase
MDEESANTMISETLCLFPRLTRSLSNIIHHKTTGNPLFVSRLLLSLSKEGLLRPSLSLRRWEWDKEKIRCQKLPDDVAMFLTNSIRVLSEDVKSSLFVLSCFGASTESAFIKTLESALETKLLDNLDLAVSEGLLDKSYDQYRFSHDRIQEAAYT